MLNFLVCALIVKIGVVVLTIREDQWLRVSGNGVNDRETESRKKRGRGDLLIMKEGADAVKRLLSGAKQIRSREKNVRVFQKAGDFKTAVHEFKSLRPAIVREASYPFGHKALYGKVGDRFI